MKVLVVGGGGREHAIIKKLKQSKLVSKLFCAPGNAGIEEDAECAAILPNDFAKLIDFVRLNEIDFTVVGSDEPLSLGIVDAFEAEGLKVFGPRKNAAILESSKAFSKELMKKYKIPTAGYEVFSDYDQALEYLRNTAFPTVLKADGLALGKGVLICEDFEQAARELKEMMCGSKFGGSGKTVVIEEFLTGPELTVLAFCDGKTLVPMVSSQDYKRVNSGNAGLNTGGMGAISPSPNFAGVEGECRVKIFEPTLNALISEAIEFKGVIYFGLMACGDGVKVIEYNARFGDPETQAVLPRLKTDLLEIFLACEAGTLDKIKIEWEENAACCLILASGGYPGDYEKGLEITGIETVRGAEVYHAGTARIDGKLVTSGGRVLGVTAVAPTVAAATKKAYTHAKGISFENMHFRNDIGS